MDEIDEIRREMSALQHRVQVVEQTILAHSKRTDNSVNRLITVVEKLMDRLEHHKPE